MWLLRLKRKSESYQRKPGRWPRGMRIGLTAISRLVCEEIMEWHHQGGEEITFDLRVLFSVNLPFDVRSKETVWTCPATTVYDLQTVWKEEWRTFSKKRRNGSCNRQWVARSQCVQRNEQKGFCVINIDYELFRGFRNMICNQKEGDLQRERSLLGVQVSNQVSADTIPPVQHWAGQRSAL